MTIYIVLFIFATLIFIFFTFYEKHRLNKVTFNTYKIILVEDDLVNKNLINVTVQSNEKEPIKSAVLGRNMKYVKGNNIILYSKIRNGKEMLISKSNFKTKYLQLFFIWSACVTMLVLAYFGSKY
jgi:hypothetical protein